MKYSIIKISKISMGTMENTPSLSLDIVTCRGGRRQRKFEIFGAEPVECTYKKNQTAKKN
jgi:hypothetical protein